MGKTRLLLSSVLIALVSGAFHEAHAQRRRPPRNPEPGNPPTTEPVTPTPTPAPVPPPTPAPAAPEPAANPPPRASASTPPAAPANQVLVSNTINRPGLHATRVEAEVFVSIGPGAWAWPWGGFVLGPGLRLGFPLTRNGMLGNLNNDLRLMIGVQGHFSVTPIFYSWLSSPITLQWNFFLSPQWSVLLEAGLTVDVFLYDLINCYDHPRLYCDRVFFHPAAAFGLRRHLSRGDAPGFPSVAFRFTYPGGVQVGLSF